MKTPRELVPDDTASLVAVAAACDQTGALSMSDSRYVDHVRGSGRVLVSGSPGSVDGYAGVVEREGSAFLTDLFVHPDARDGGRGGSLLGAAWDGFAGRATSASQDPRALASYARFGASPLWPMVYLEIPGARTSPAAPVRRSDTAPGDARWTLPLDSLATHTVVSGPGLDATTAVVRATQDRISVLRAITPDPRGLAVLLADLRGRVGPDGVVDLVVPGPHPALPDLLAQGARVTDVDLWCASPAARDLVDPTRELPSPALA